MGISHFIRRQITQIRRGGRNVLSQKISRFLNFLLYPFALIAVLAGRCLRPIVLIRFGALHSDIIGVFAAMPELFLCEKDAGINQPGKQSFDVWYFGPGISNQQLARMWQRVFRVWPRWMIAPVVAVNRLIPGGEAHEIRKNNCRDVRHLFERFPSHLQLTADEESWGKEELRKFGVETDAKFVCILARDGGFKANAAPNMDWSYHDYRNTDVNNYVPAAEALVAKGFYVFRMGSFVTQRLNTQNPKIIDYASDGRRSDFMDIYLGAKCEFCITMGSGWDAIPFVFRRSIVYVNLVPLGYIHSFSARYLSITRHHWSTRANRKLTLNEIFSHGVAFAQATLDYREREVRLIENTPEEILEVTLEMVARLDGTWQEQTDDEMLQSRFLSQFRAHAYDPPNGQVIHGELRGRFGAGFLRRNRDWLD